MNEAKKLSIPMAVDCKLSNAMRPKTDQEKEEISRIPHASAVGSLMYMMISTRLDVSHSISVMRRFADPGKKHWEMLKRVLRYLKET